MNHLKILLLSSFLFLPGCALYDAYMMAGYDSNEYGLATQVRTLAEVGQEQCGTPAVDKTVQTLYIASFELKNFTEHTPDNEKATALAADLHKIVKPTYEKFRDGDVSLGYCKAKLKMIAKNANTIQEAYGSKPR